MMSKIRLVDVGTQQEEFMFGTCDLCFFSRELEVTSYEFEYEDGTSEVILDADYDYAGFDLVYVPDFHITRFAGWLEKQEFPRDYRISSTEELDKLVMWFVADTRGDE